MGGEGEGGTDVRQVTDLVVDDCLFGLRSHVLWFIAGLEASLLENIPFRIKKSAMIFWDQK